jgi:7-alpha-hydroxysteroid dehydrogenase
MTTDEIRSEMERNTPMRRIGRVEDIAACVLYLVSEAGSYVTGKVLQVDGGLEHPQLAIPITPL